MFHLPQKLFSRRFSFGFYSYFLSHCVLSDLYGFLDFINFLFSSSIDRRLAFRPFTFFFSFLVLPTRLFLTHYYIPQYTMALFIKSPQE